MRPAQRVEVLAKGIYDGYRQWLRDHDMPLTPAWRALASCDRAKYRACARAGLAALEALDAKHARRAGKTSRRTTNRPRTKK